MTENKVTANKKFLALLSILLASAAAIETHADSYYVCMSGTWTVAAIDQYCGSDCYSLDTATCSAQSAPASKTALSADCGADSRALGGKCVVVKAGESAPQDKAASAASPAASPTPSPSPSASSSSPPAQSGAEEAGFQTANCECTCAGKTIQATGIYKPGSFMGITNPLEDKQMTAATKCQEQCARTCGGFTNCSDQTDTGCDTCCTTYCTSSYSAGSGSAASDPCNTSCKSTCKFRGTVNGITDIIYMAAGILGALMIAIHGIRMVTSQDPNERDASKSSIIHVILALIIIAMAAALVNMFISMGGVGGPVSSDTGSSSGGTISCTDYKPTVSMDISKGCADYGSAKGVKCYWASSVCNNCDSIKQCSDYGADPNACPADQCGVGGTKKCAYNAATANACTPG